MHLIVGLFFIGLIIVAAMMVFQLVLTVGMGIIIGFFAAISALFRWIWGKITFTPGAEDEEA